MAETAILRFKAKRTDNGAYKVPTFTSAHVATPRTQQGTRHALMFGGRTTEDIARRRQTAYLDAAGIPPYYVEDRDARPGVLEIRPVGNGFMAEITFTVDLSAR